jgi:long-chain acyl-CoA synthetase
MPKTYAPDYPSIDYRDLREIFHESARRWEGKPAYLVRRKLGEPAVPRSFRQFSDDVDALGTALVSELGLSGAFVAVLGENRYEWMVSYLAAVGGTGVVVPIDKELPVHEAALLLARCGATALLHSGRLSAHVAALRVKAPGVRHFVDMDAVSHAPDGATLSMSALIATGRARIAAGDRAFLDAPIDREALAVLLFTSGTTSASKAVQLSHRNLCANIRMIQGAIAFGDEDTDLSILPLHHTYEATMLLSLLSKGATTAFCDGLRYIAQNLREYRPTTLTLVPLIIENLHKKIQDGIRAKPAARALLPALVTSGAALAAVGIDVRRKMFHSLHEPLGGRIRVIVSGAAALDPKVWKSLLGFGFRIRQGYGMTEASPAISNERDRLFRQGSVGVLLPGMSGKIADPDPDSGIGEIWVQGDNVMMGYFQDPVATAATLQDGWLRTGDLGRFDQDGFLYITGRCKNVIVTKNGKNIYPEELEGLLARSPFIKECLVVGEQPEEGSEAEDGCKVVAVVVPDLDALRAASHDQTVPVGEALKAILRGEIRRVNQQVPAYKRIVDLRIRDEEFEKTTTRKIKRFKLFPL